MKVKCSSKTRILYPNNQKNEQTNFKIMHIDFLINLCHTINISIVGHEILQSENY